MAEPHWTGYVGMFTGLIGAATGITGAILGIVSYRKSNRLKSLDLRIEFKKAITNAHSDCAQLIEKIPSVHSAIKTAAAALGLISSSFMDKWNRQAKEDKKTALELRKDLPEQNGKYDDLDPNSLETKLIEVHRLQKRIKALSDKWDRAETENDERVRRYNEDRRSYRP